jgi:hypothetical protein
MLSSDGEVDESKYHKSLNNPDVIDDEYNPILEEMNFSGSKTDESTNAIPPNDDERDNKANFSETTDTPSDGDMPSNTGLEINDVEYNFNSDHDKTATSSSAGISSSKELMIDETTGTSSDDESNQVVQSEKNRIPFLLNSSDTEEDTSQPPAKKQNASKGQYFSSPNTFFSSPDEHRLNNVSTRGKNPSVPGLNEADSHTYDLTQPPTKKQKTSDTDIDRNKRFQEMKKAGITPTQKILDKISSEKLDGPTGYSYSFHPD